MGESTGDDPFPGETIPRLVVPDRPQKSPVNGSVCVCQLMETGGRDLWGWECSYVQYVREVIASVNKEATVHGKMLLSYHALDKNYTAQFIKLTIGMCYYYLFLE